MKKQWLLWLGGIVGLSILLTGCANPSEAEVAGQSNVFVSPDYRDVQRVAVLPFQAETQLIGASVSDIFIAELLKFGRYELIERGQLNNVLGETEVALSGLTAGQAAQVGQMLGADAVVLGTVSEYETVAQRGHTLPVVGVNVRMVDAASGRILWSTNHAARGQRGDTLAQHARKVLQAMARDLYRNL